MKRIEIAQYIAVGATCLVVISFILAKITGANFFVSLMGLGVMGGMVSYFFGGFGTAVRMSGKIAKWGWLILPFPYDIMTGIVQSVKKSSRNRLRKPKIMMLKSLIWLFHVST